MRGDITQLLRKCEDGDQDAAEALYRVYMTPLLSLARARLPAGRMRIDDEEDVALSAMNSFLMGVQRGRFAELSSRDNLWRLLLTITLRKISARRRHDHAAKRGGGRVLGESAVGARDAEPAPEGLQAAPDEGFGPADAAALRESCDRLLACLDHLARRVALRKLEGCTNAEIADELACTTRTVERKLSRIRAIWRTLDDDS